MQKKITEILQNFGLENFGVCRFDAQHLFPCAAKRRLPEQASTILVFLFPYAVEKKRPKNISRYAAVCDYHPVILNRLQNAAAALQNAFAPYRFEAFCDNSPIYEVDAAVRAGLGVRGENNLLITEKYGSFVFIGEIVTNLNLNAVDSVDNGCLQCGACRKHCPTGYLQKNAAAPCSCLSAITQQKKPLTGKEEALLQRGGSVWGCDICQEVCPMNSCVTFAAQKEFSESYRKEYQIGENAENRAYNWRGPEIIVRNARLLARKKQQEK